jgi:hypothetical protein
MNRFVALAALAAFVAACSDTPTAPTSIHPTDASFDEGIPPPPPVTSESDGEGSFSASRGEEVDRAITGSAPVTSCFVGGTITYSYDYLAAPRGPNEAVFTDPSINQVAHINIHTFNGLPASGQITLHHTPNQPLGVAEGNGTIKGTFGGSDFSFNITKAVGTLTPLEFSLDIAGNLKTENGTCKANGSVFGDLFPDWPGAGEG